MKINQRKSFICGIKSTKLSQKEYLFIKKNKPWGIILFQRNIKNIDQVVKFTSGICLCAVVFKGKICNLQCIYLFAICLSIGAGMDRMPWAMCLRSNTLIDEVDVVK